MEIQHVDNQLVRVGVPVPFPMKYVYCYLFRDENEWTLIDVGFNYSEARDTWLKVFQELHIAPTQIRKIYLTHFHPDHTGLAGWMQELTGATVYISQTDLDMMNRVWGSNSSQVQKVGEMCQQNGVPIKLVDEIKEHMEKLNQHVYPQPTLTQLEEKEIELGGKRWEVIETPGHSDGHICFYQKEDQTLLAGDHVLDKITPNVSLWPIGHPNPLKNYIASLQKVRLLQVKKALTAHGKVVTDLSQRVDEILIHHDERLERMRLLARGTTAYQVAEQLFNDRELTPHQWRFAMAETLAHLEFLVQEGKLNKINQEPIIYSE